VSPVTQCPALFTEKSVVEAEEETRSELVPLEVSEPQMVSLLYGVELPIPTFPAKYALPVVVAPPEMVSPPAWVPLPIVEEAVARRLER